MSKNMIIISKRKDLTQYQLDTYPDITEIEWQVGKLINNKLCKYPNIETFVCSNNQIVVLTPLSDKCKLKKIVCNNNKIETVDHVATCENLTYVDFSCNKIETITALSNLKKLSYLNLNNNMIRSVSTLTNICVLHIDNNRGVNLESISECYTLTELSANGNDIENIHFLKMLVNLEKLCLCKNKITDLTPIAECKKIVYLDVSNNFITDMQPLEVNILLENVYINNNMLTNIECTVNFKNLKKFECSNNRLGKPSITVRRLLNSIGIEKIDVDKNKIPENTEKIQDVQKKIRKIETQISDGNFQNIEYFVENSHFEATNFALEFAAYYGNLDIFKKLISYKADVNWSNCAAVTAASKNGHNSIIEYVFENCTVTKNIFSALLVAVQSNHTDTIKLLLSINSKADCKYFDIKQNNSLVLQIATENKNFEIVDLLLKLGADGTEIC